MLMETSMRGSGSMIKLMAMELTSMLMVQLMLENGMKTNSTALESRNGQMVQNTRVSIKMVKNMETVV